MIMDISISSIMDLIRIHGSKWGAFLGKEGPRDIGHCVYCAGPCEGATGLCQMRVYADRIAKEGK